MQERREREKERHAQSERKKKKEISKGNGKIERANRRRYKFNVRTCEEERRVRDESISILNQSRTCEEERRVREMNLNLPHTHTSGEHLLHLAKPIVEHACEELAAHLVRHAGVHRLRIRRKSTQSTCVCNVRERVQPYRKRENIKKLI